LVPAQDGSSGFDGLARKICVTPLLRVKSSSLRGILTFQNTGLDAHAAREFEVALNGRTRGLDRSSAALGGHGDGEAPAFR
jgi:hypothetical protein